MPGTRLPEKNAKGQVNLLHCSYGEQTARLLADRPIFSTDHRIKHSFP